MKRFALITGGVIVLIGLAIGLGAFLPGREAVYDFIILYSANLGVINRVPIYDTAAIIHLMDPPDLFPYKQPQMRKVFDAFRRMLAATVDKYGLPRR